MKYSRKQQLVSEIERTMPENRYIVNEREKGQKRIFKCNCCGVEHDLSNSIDYVGAVDQWEALGGMCYACGKGFCKCKEGGWPKYTK